MSQGVVVATAAEVPRRGARWRSRLSERPLLWIAPLALLLFASYIYPALEVIRFSFTDATLLNPDYNYTLDTYSAASENPSVVDAPVERRTTCTSTFVPAANAVTTTCGFGAPGVATIAHLETSCAKVST